MEILLVKIGQIWIQMHFKWCNDTLTQCSIYIWEPVPLRSAQASVRAKVNNSSQIGLGYQQRLMKVVFLSNTWAIWQNQKSWNENNVFSSGTHSHSLWTDWWKEFQPGRSQGDHPDFMLFVICSRNKGIHPDFMFSWCSGRSLLGARLISGILYKTSLLPWHLIQTVLQVWAKIIISDSFFWSFI